MLMKAHQHHRLRLRSLLRHHHRQRTAKRFRPIAVTTKAATCKGYASEGDTSFRHSLFKLPQLKQPSAPAIKATKAYRLQLLQQRQSRNHRLLTKVRTCPCPRRTFFERSSKASAT